MAASKRIALTFLVGAVVVGWIVGYASANVLEVRDAHADQRVSYRDRLAKELKLSPEQRIQLDSVLDKRHRDMTAAWEPVRPALDSIRERARDEIREMLAPNQRAIFEQILLEQRRDNQARNDNKKDDKKNERKN
jgi:cell division protein FtsN